MIAHREHSEVIAKALLEYETLDGVQIKEIIKHGRLINPPPGPPRFRGSEDAAGKTAETSSAGARCRTAASGRSRRRSSLTLPASRVGVRLHFTPLNFHEVA